MGHLAIAVGLGLAAGLLAGGRPANAGTRPLRWWPAVVAAVVAQALAEVVSAPSSVLFAAVVASYAAVLAFAGRNLRAPGMALIAIGITLNLTVSLMNGGMPVRGTALVDAGLVSHTDLEAVDLGAKRHVERPDDRLTVLGDVLAVPPLRQVLSPGDVLVAVGVSHLVFRLLRPTSRRAGGRGSAPFQASAAGAP